MKKILISLAAVASCSLSGLAFAQNGQGGYTREEVLAELRLMRATGELEERHITEASAVQLRDVDMVDMDEAKTRAEVRQELIDARHAASNTWVPMGERAVQAQLKPMVSE